MTMQSIALPMALIVYGVILTFLGVVMMLKPPSATSGVSESLHQTPLERDGGIARHTTDDDPVLNGEPPPAGTGIYCRVSAEWWREKVLGREPHDRAAAFETMCKQGLRWLEVTTDWYRLQSGDATIDELAKHYIEQHISVVD